MKSFFSLRSFAPLAALLLLVAPRGRSAEGGAPPVHLEQGGIEVDAGSIGKFTVEYPGLLDGSQKPVTKLLDKAVAGGTATLHYEGGAEVKVSPGEGGKVLLHLEHMPAGLKYLEFNMQIPISFNQGGHWKVGEKTADFPREKPASPHLFQGNATALEITNYEGRTLVITTPQYSYLQLTDNREWSWAIFHFKSVSPFDAGRKDVSLVFHLEAATEKAKPLVDEFGQSTRDDWPGKVKSVEELKADLAAEKADAANEHPPAGDQYGGLPGSKEKLSLKTTGFFHLEKQGERALLVDPAGNLFFHLGLCTVSPGEDYTLVKGREGAFAWLPPHQGEFATAWKADAGGTVVSFHLANLIRKYGQPYDPDTYTARMIERMRHWGFNSIGAFSGGSRSAEQAAHCPRVTFLPLGAGEVPQLPGIGQVWDPFDDNTRKKVEENFARTLPPHVDDPLLVGYFMTNEPIYENIPHLVPTFKASEHACKKHFVDFLESKYRTIAVFNTAWSLNLKGFDELKEMIVPVDTKAAKADAQEFSIVFLEEMFRFVADMFHRHDKNHLLLGSRLMPGTINNEALCRTIGKYVDVMSFNYYTKGVDKGLLRHVYAWTGGRPMMLSEFYWSAARESGLTGGLEVGTQQERGLAYRNYVEQSTALGFVIGIEWFTLIDQAVTGRSFQGLNGERANTGILAVTDRPWKAALTEMMKTNFDIYKIELGEKPPFTWDNPQFKNTP